MRSEGSSQAWEASVGLVEWLVGVVEKFEAAVLEASSRLWTCRVARREHFCSNPSKLY